MNYTIEQTVNMLNIHSPSGYTNMASDYLIKELASLGITAHRTLKGAVLATIGGEGNPLILASHVDTLGAMISNVKGNGRLSFVPIGGLNPNSIDSENCTIFTRSGKQYTGMFQLNNPSAHVTPSAMNELRTHGGMEVILDEYVKTAADVKALGIQTGDYICPDVRCIVTPSGYIKSRHLDDKASSGVLLTIAKLVSEGNIKLSRKVYLLFSVYEEVGHGATSSLPSDATEIISVDMGCVGGELACDETMVSICVKDSTGPYDYDLNTRLINSAKEAGVDYALDVYPSYGSDAAAALRAGYELKHACVGPGVYCSHGYERTHEKGIMNTLNLLVNFVQK